MKPLEQLQKSLKIPLFIEEPQSINYLFDINVSAGSALISSNEVKLYLDPRYFEFYRHLPFVELLPDQIPFPEVVGVDSSFTTLDRLASLKKLHPQTVWEGLSKPIETLRQIKTEEEKRKLRKAGALNSLGHDFLLSLLKEGVEESELARKLHLFFIEKGGEAFSFEPIIAFGASSAIPHYRAGSSKLKKGDIVLLDHGVKVDGYHSDMTRTVFFGSPHAELEKIYHIVQQAQEKALAAVKPKISSIDLDNVARSLISEAGYGAQFVHSLGHGIGLDIHENPFLRNKEPSALIKENMAITIEPGIYIPNLGGVRIEDAVIVTAEGYEDLTNRSKSLKVIPC